MVLAAPVAAVAALAGWSPRALWAALVVALAAGLVVLARCEGMLRRIRREGDASSGAS